MMNTVIQKLAGALIFLGLLVAVPYSVYVIFLSGEKIGDYQIKKGVAAMTTSGNAMSATESKSGRFGPLELDPSMNLFRVTLAYSKRPNVERVYAHARLISALKTARASGSGQVAR